jgi:tetratricopeptide (TPR) repeat protein
MIERSGKGSVFQLLGYSGRASVYKEMKDDDRALGDLYSIAEHGSWITEEYKKGKENSLHKFPWDIVPIKAHYECGQIYKYKAFWNKDKSINYEETRLEMKQKAIAELSKAIELADLAELEEFANDRYFLADCYRERADLYEEISEFNNAIEDYSAVIKLDKKGNVFHLKEVYEKRMKLYLKLGGKEKAFNDYVKTTELSEWDDYTCDDILDLNNYNYEILEDVE